jgi:alanine racemase
VENYLNAEISASAVAANLALLRGLLAPGVKLCAVVKADCYGHGLSLLLDTLAGEADCLAVATPEEALALRRMGYQRPILMFFSACAFADGKERRDALAELIAGNITLTVTSQAELAVVSEVAAKTAAQAVVHVKIDSGMGRSGVLAEQAGELVRLARRQRGVKLAGLYTHFATADEADKNYARQQLRRFLAAVQDAGGGEGLILHAANSAATIDLPETHLDMVRPGIAVYGYQPSDDIHNRLPLRPALRLTGKLMQIKNLSAGSRCGYGLTRAFDRPSRVGLVPVGYADGYMRCLSNRATMRIRGQDVPVCGRVSMDQIILDLTDVPPAAIGDDVEIISPDPAAPHSVANLARLAGTIPYEITCRLGKRVRRKLIDH